MTVYIFNFTMIIDFISLSSRLQLLQFFFKIFRLVPKEIEIIYFPYIFTTVSRHSLFLQFTHRLEILDRNRFYLHPKMKVSISFLQYKKEKNMADSNLSFPHMYTRLKQYSKQPLSRKSFMHSCARLLKKIYVPPPPPQSH